MTYPIAAGIILFSFFCGAVPTGYLLIRFFRHQDIREIGSGNIGSTNVKRAAGTGLSVATQIIDILKGLIPVGVSLAVSRSMAPGYATVVLPSAAALAAILGHDFSPFLKFRGGKGVNTTIGSFLPLAPVPVVIGIGMYLTLRMCTPIVSIRSLALGLTIPIMTLALELHPAVVCAAWIAGLLILIRHQGNIRRLLQHKELR